MRDYSTDLREKMVLACEAGEGTLDQIAHTFDVSRCTHARMMRLWRAGESLASLPHGGGYPATLHEQLLAVLRQQVAAQPDATLVELTAHLKRRVKVEVHLSSGLPCATETRSASPKSLAASERCEAERQAFRQRVAGMDRRRFVFIDETGFHLAMTRRFGRAARGHRVTPKRAMQSR